MATFNGSRYLQEQIASILPQLSEVDEIILSDDGSTDNTLQIAKSFNDARVKILHIENAQQGVIKNFEKALSHANGDYIFLCDQDDVWLPNKVQECLRKLNESLLVVTDCKVVDESLNVYSQSFFNYRNSGPGVLKNIWKNTYLGCCMAFRRELLDIAIPIPLNVPMHDMWLGILANIFGKVSFIQKPLLLYRRHELASSPTGKASQFGIFQKCYMRIILIFYLFLRISSFLLLKVLK